MAAFPIAVITDEFSQDFERVCATAVELDIAGLEIRTAWDKNVLAMSDGEIDQLKQIADGHGRRFVAVASPVYKCVLPEGGEIDQRFRQDAFRAAYDFADQPRILARALEIARRLEAPVVRVFSFWRTVRPERNFRRITEILAEGGEIARQSGVLLGLENEPACHFATGEEVAGAIDELDPDPYGVVWDPGNAFVAGEAAVPHGYREIPAGRICHVHVKDCTRDPSGGQPQWCDIGAGRVGWQEQLSALEADGYAGTVSLETHWTGPGGDKYLGTTICAKSLARLLAQA